MGKCTFGKAHLHVINTLRYMATLFSGVRFEQHTTTHRLLRLTFYLLLHKRTCLHIRHQKQSVNVLELAIAPVEIEGPSTKRHEKK